MSASGKTAIKGSVKSVSHQSSGKQSQSHKNVDKTQRTGRAATDNDTGDEVGIRKSVMALMETTCRTEEEVCSALHDCDNDIEKACDMLLENDDLSQGQWKTNEKKKKKAASNTAANAGNPNEREIDDWATSTEKTGGSSQGGGTSFTSRDSIRDNRSSSRGRGSGRPYRGRGGDLHGNGEDVDGMSSRGGLTRRGMMGRGGGRGGGRGSSRGGRGSRPPRGARHSHHSEENWVLGGSNVNSQDPQADGWGDSFPMADDWDNEEWSGSLADTKVFTPSSSSALESATVTSEVTTTSHITSTTDQSSLHHTVINSYQQDSSEYQKQTGGVLGQESTSPPPTLPSLLPQDPAIYGYTNSTHHLPKSQSPVAMSVTGALSAAQSQYLSQLTQKSEPMKQDNRVLLNSQVYNTNYTVYGADISNARKPVQRARVPPPSKIPSSAVEMPGDLDNSSLGSLGVQFGALDFGSDAPSFLTDGVASSAPSSVTNSDKYNTTSASLDHTLTEGTNGVPNQQSSLDAHQTSANSLSNDVSAYSSNATRSSQMISSDSLSTGTSDQNVSGSNSQYGTVVSRTVPPSVSTPHVPQLTTVAGLESQLTGKSSGVTDLSSQQSAYSTYPGQTATYGVSQPSKQTYHPHHGYTANPYSQVNSSATSFTAASSIANTYPPTNTLNQYQHVSHTQQLNSYPSSSVYGGNGLYTASSVPYNSYQALNSSNKISSNVKDSQYDGAVTTANLSISQQPTQSTQSSSKMSSTSGKSNSSSTSVMNSASAAAGSHVGAATVMGQYMISQPYYQQPMPYAFEEVQLMQQRLPHHLPSGYYEVGYGTGGSGAGTGARDAPIASFGGSLAAGTAEARFSRAEAPSPQAVAGGAAGAGGAQPPQTAMPSYAYYAYSTGSMLPAGSFQYGAQTIYPIPTAGGTGSSNYGGGKGVGVGSAGAYVGSAGGVVGAYGAPAPAAAPPPQTYEAVQPSQPLNHQQDYKSGGYSSTQQSSVVKQGVNNSSSGTGDLNSTMYGGKSHVSLSKVNSYDKAYHSATPPPPFGIGATAGGVANVGAGGYTGPIYLQHTMPPPPQQHQMDGRGNSNHRRDNGSSNPRGGSSGQSKQGGGAKQGYSPSYWTQN